ncbi:MAG: DUF3054 domain-containing protein [Actinobacteria bacterium]|nr:DUF3054 domain-containing protein [Actinomycetota bacterium]
MTGAVIGAERSKSATSVGVAMGLDAIVILVFVAIGRSSHTEGETLAGIASTSWPFLVGAAVGWILSRAWQHPTRLWPAGVVVWSCAVAVGMGLRVIAGQGTALSFTFVALGFLGATLLGWRLVALGVRRVSERP